MPNSQKKYALISVSNKRGVENLARGLVDLGYVVISTGGTAKAISAAGLPVTTVAQYIGMAPMLDGRVKTLHPKVHVGILVGDDEEELAEARAISANPISVVAVNLPDVESSVLLPSATIESVLEEIDLGGAALLRSAARNFNRVTVVCDPGDYEKVLWHIARSDEVSREYRLELAIKAFAHTAAYDAAVVTGFSNFDVLK